MHSKRRFTHPSSAIRTFRFALRLLVLTGLWLVASVGAAHDTAPMAAATGGPTQGRLEQVEALTQSLLELGAQYSAALPEARRALENDLVSSASTRRQLLASLIEDDPGSVLDAALPAHVRAKLPSSLTGYLEQDVQLEGTLEILHEDRQDGGRYHFVLQSASGRHALHFAGARPEHLLTGTSIRVRGVQIGNLLALGGDATSVQQLASPPVANALGAQSTVVILVNFSDNPAQPYTIAEAQDAIFGTTSRFFLENSYQQAWLTGNVYGWYTIPVTSVNCDYAEIASQAKAAATAAGVNLSSYVHHVYAFPKNACGWWGLSTVGGAPSQSWINGELQLGVLAHELGHGHGLWHSHALDCGTAAVVGYNCTTNEYGDILDMMGASRVAQYNAFQKERLGWLNYNASPPITTVLADGMYTIDTYETMGSGPKALKILKSTDASTGLRTWYYVESRQAIGFDDFLADPGLGTQNVTTGVLVHTGSESSGNTGFLLDMTPATPVYYWWYDPALAVGQTFTDPDTGVTITTAWVTGTAAGVTVKLGSSSSTGPIAVSVSTDRASYARGQTVTVTSKVTSGSSPVANAQMNFTIIKSTGSTITAGATTAGNGTAVYKLRLNKKDPAGTYQVRAQATSGEQSVTAATTFVVQ